ncbi:MAG TPA: hypothetical protein VNZ57_13100 [Longimicrobiales bacterium]|nr:hypothetical protein [Longimicrobiales bacterium]
MKKLPLVLATVAAAATILVASPAAHAQVHHDLTFSFGADQYVGTVPTALDRQIAAALAAAAAQILADLNAGTLTDPNGAEISDDAQALVLGVIQGNIPPEDIQAILLNSGAEGPSEEVAKALVNLLTNPQAGQVAAFIGHFNELVMNASPAFLANPPDVFRAIWAIATQLGQAATP